MSRRTFVDQSILYVFSVNIEFSLNFEQVGIVPGGARLNLACVPRRGRVYNVLNERTVGINGYPVVTGTLLFGRDPVQATENDTALANVRAVLLTDDGAVIDTRYAGVMPFEPGGFRSLVAGVPSGEANSMYELVVTPIYETTDARYTWLTEYQCVGFGRVERRDNVFRRVSYDIYAMM